jgi:hypothetical protein
MVAARPADATIPPQFELIGMKRGSICAGRRSAVQSG